MRLLPLIASLAALSLLAGAVYLLIPREQFSTLLQSQNSPARQTATSPSPDPIPFSDLTIPHLRAREYPGQLSDLRQLAETQEYTSYLTSYESDGLRIDGLLTIPSGDQPAEGWPAIVFIHGYIPPAQYRTTERYVSYVDYLARSGFVVFKIDLRGHGESEGEPGGAYYSSDYIIDALSARTALQNSDFVGENRVGFWGHSMSGNVVLRTLAARPEIPAAVIWGGAVFSYNDWQRYGLNDNSYRPPSTATERQRRRSELFAEHGEFGENSAFWSQVAPTNYLSELTGGVQLHHAIDDGVVNVGYSRDLAASLEHAGADYQFHEYASGGHNIDGASFSTAMQRTVEFFRERL